MKKLFLFLVVSFFVGKNCEAQNLVPNPSFEDTLGCPNNEDQVYLSNGWHCFGGTPEYFNQCSIEDSVYGVPIAGVPYNWPGFQIPYNGVAYCGVYCFDKIAPDSREYIGRLLSTPLVVGQKYFASIKISLAEKSSYAVNNIGINFRTNAYTDSINWMPLETNHSFVHCSSIISDTSNWVVVSGSFYSDSAYQYVMVGNFYDHSLIDTVRVNNNFNGIAISYYYIDDVCVSPDSITCDLNPEEIYNLKEAKASVNLYPNPATNQLTVESAMPVGSNHYAVSRIEITDAVGRVQSFKFNILNDAIPSRDGIVRQIDIHFLASGIYFIKLYFGDGTMEVKKFAKE